MGNTFLLACADKLSSNTQIHIDRKKWDGEKLKKDELTEGKDKKEN